METKALTEEQAHRLADVHRRLTKREREYFEHFCNSLSQKEIAFEMRVSLQTTSSHKANIMRKLGVATKLELVGLAVRLGLAA